jgi:hypothetical protein
MHEEGSCCARKVARAVLNHGRGTARTVVISIAPKAANVRIALARIARFYDFQAEYRLPTNIKWPLKPVRCQRTRGSGWMIASTCRIDGRTTRSFGQLRLHHVINPDKVFGTHNVEYSPISLSLTDVFIC